MTRKFWKQIVIMLVVVLMASMAQVASAFTVESTTEYLNKFIWQGYHVADDTFVQQVAVRSGGFDLSAAWLNPIDDVDDVERWDLAAGYTWRIADGLTSRIGAGSFLYAELDADDGFDVHSVSFAVRHDSGVAYTIAHLFPDNGSSVVEAGQLHVLSVDREIGPVRTFGDVTYNDGFSPFAGEIIDDFSHARAGAVLDGPLGLRATYYHQWALHDAFADQDVVGVGFVVRK
jgi:hypothetical protein